MEVQQALAMGRRLLREHGLDGWSIVADRAKTRAGVCRFGRRQIGISAPLTALHSEDEVRDTLLHEIAHALVGPEHGHDEVWRATAVRIGCSGSGACPPTPRASRATGSAGAQRVTSAPATAPPPG
ncbi:SprT family zinc-dependent metalloprotease [Phycicoccus sp. HDW14]|uniref:SprT family zinc-dependent metalloprotease n=1 Tax=Phycicoccus sp. HDW14 TaxID=2714941 RepID=UPI001F10622F|nr:SprT family zinc-dependent metalloprotease [Phycicoccus sp. HDW14]